LHPSTAARSRPSNLKEPPRTGERGEDFRTLPASVSPRDNALLDSLLRDMRARQEMLRGLLEDEDEASAHPFVGSASLKDEVPGVAASIAETLGFDPLKRRAGNAGDLFRALRTRTEAIGVFVLLVADLGSHHSAISEKDAPRSAANTILDLEAMMFRRRPRCPWSIFFGGPVRSGPVYPK